MHIKRPLIAVGGLIAVLGFGMLAARDPQTPLQEVGAKGKKPAPPKMDDDKDAEAIRAQSAAFSAAFARGDAKAVAAFWTAQGEYHDDSGAVIRGRADIEKAYADFFKDKPQTKIEVQIFSIRPTSRDSAIEEGMLRQISPGNALPTTTLYSAVHVREAGEWKIAIAREWGAGQDRLEDLEWLIGAWHAKLKDREMTLDFAKDKNKPFLVGTFTTKTKDKVVASGSMKIGFDAQRGQIRSWHFDDDGGHGQAVWIRDGNRWVLDAVGVLANGTETGALNILGRLGQNEITWRSIDRVVGEERVPDTVPIKLSRVSDKK